LYEAMGAGFLLGFSLILAIGAQNAFVLRQGLKGEYVLPLVLTCAISDALLIAAGVAGFGALVLAFPLVVSLAKWGGAAFLIVYGFLSFRSALREGGALETSGKTATGLWAAVSTCLLLTWANPHVYLDTVVLLGGISAQYSPTWSLALSFSFHWVTGQGCCGHSLPAHAHGAFLTPSLAW